MPSFLPRLNSEGVSGTNASLQPYKLSLSSTTALDTIGYALDGAELQRMRPYFLSTPALSFCVYIFVLCMCSLSLFCLFVAATAGRPYLTSVLSHFILSATPVRYF